MEGAGGAPKRARAQDGQDQEREARGGAARAGAVTETWSHRARAVDDSAGGAALETDKPDAGREGSKALPQRRVRQRSDSDGTQRQRSDSGRGADDGAPSAKTFVPVALPQQAVALLESLPLPVAAATSLAMQLGASALHHMAEHHVSLTSLRSEVFGLRSICATLARQNASLAQAFATQLARRSQERAGAAAAAALAAQIANDLADLDSPLPDHGDLQGYQAGRGNAGDESESPSSDAAETGSGKALSVEDGGVDSGGDAGPAANNQAAAAA